MIVDRRGRVVAEGWHKKLGAAHAEADALAKVNGRAKGCTMYVNLEPCKHRSKRRTEPCAPKVAAAGIERLVIGTGDPIRSHGGGAAWLKRQGVEVIRNVRADACRELNRAFFIWARKQRPWFLLKAGVTLDGRVATRTGESQWITGPEARKDVHRLRGRLDAIMVGVGTVLADDPALTCRGVRRARDPVRVVVDSRLRTPPEAKLLPANTDSKARVLIATTPGAAKTRERRLVAAGAEVVRVPGRGRRVSLSRLSTLLAANEIASVLVEGGAELHGALVRAGLVDDVRLYMAPMLFGGAAAPSWLGGDGVGRIAQAPRFRFHGGGEPLGDDLVITARPVQRARSRRNR